MFDDNEQPQQPYPPTKTSRFVLPVVVTLPLFLFVAIASAFAAVYFVDRTGYTPNLPAFTLDVSSFEYGARPELAQAEYFLAVRERFIADEASFVEADLSAMRLRVYQDGVVTKDVPIKSKGREGSWWETPAGLYRIEAKKENHFSSFGQVYQPWSMIFQGNFFIHGWPYYPDGTPVASTYSGGCIRLADEDAEAVYQLVSTGMPVLVYSDRFHEDNFAYSPNLPNVSAERYLVADLGNNYVFLEQGSDDQVPIASLTKLVTALVASEYINLDNPITITQTMLATTSLPRLRAGEKIRALDLLYPLLLESSNEAAAALAQTLGKARFVGLMQKKVQALGMLDTVLVDASGSGAGNISTPQDLFHLLKYLQYNRSFVLKLTTGELNRSAYGKAHFTNLHNFNLFAGDPSFLGGKVGQTLAAKETMVALFEIPFEATPRSVAIIVLGSNDVARDVQTLLAYTRANYRGRGG